MLCFFFFFFSSRRRHTRCLSDWSSDVCSSDLLEFIHVVAAQLIVVLVVDQMRGDYVDKFKGQWNGGLKRLLDEGAWFREARSEERRVGKECRSRWSPYH